MNRLNSQEYMNMVNLFGKENYLYVNEQYPYGNVGYDGKWTPIFTSEQIANANYDRLVELCVEDRTSQ